MIITKFKDYIVEGFETVPTDQEDIQSTGKPKKVKEVKEDQPTARAKREQRKLAKKKTSNDVDIPQAAEMAVEQKEKIS